MLVYALSAVSAIDLRLYPGVGQAGEGVLDDAGLVVVEGQDISYI